MLDNPLDTVFEPDALVSEHQAAAYEICTRAGKEAFVTKFDEPDTHVHPPFLKYDYNLYVPHHHHH
ncbi:MAG: hypothetical protein SFW62_02550 [Alphaproteobacteria bacterium]|nr:hypothetical protein [Alphaproteobacteria bacterium]